MCCIINVHCYTNNSNTRTVSWHWYVVNLYIILVICMIDIIIIIFYMIITCIHDQHQFMVNIKHMHGFMINIMLLHSYVINVIHLHGYTVNNTLACLLGKHNTFSWLHHFTWSTSFMQVNCWYPYDYVMYRGMHDPIANGYVINVMQLHSNMINIMT